MSYYPDRNDEHVKPTGELQIRELISFADRLGFTSATKLNEEDGEYDFAGRFERKSKNVLLRSLSIIPFNKMVEIYNSLSVDKEARASRWSHCGKYSFYTVGNTTIPFYTKNFIDAIDPFKIVVDRVKLQYGKGIIQVTSEKVRGFENDFQFDKVEE